MKAKSLKKQLKSILHKYLKEYLRSVEPLSEDEKIELYEWVAAGKSVKSNPYFICDESGWPMDFINGIRIGADMFENPSNYFPAELDTFNDECGSEEELPF